jgi:peptidoglycan/xylan/chitin deacetylase (PgdA/CDA1 family)
MAAILLYHAVAEQVVDGDLQVSPFAIQQHLAWGRQLGFQPASLVQVLSDSGSKSLAITFDDALASIAPMLRTLIAQSIVPTVFLCPDSVGRENSWASPGRTRERILNLAELIELRDEGLAFGCHGWDHRPYLRRHFADMSAEIERCLDWFGTQLQIQPSVFSWPFGLFDETAVEVVSRSFPFALGIDPEWGRDVRPWSIPRIAPRLVSTFATFEDDFDLKTFSLDKD